MWALHVYSCFILWVAVRTQELTSIVVGLFSPEIPWWEYKLAENVTCQPFIPTVNETCKYYGDCCNDPMRIHERLVTGTFTCTNEGMYVLTLHTVLRVYVSIHMY